MKTGCLAAILVLISAAAGAAESTAPPKVKAIVGGTVVNIGGGAPIQNAVVLIEGEKIRSIGPAGTEVPAGAEVIRAAGTWLIPGLMNMHVHLGLKLPGRDRAALAEETTAAVTLRMMVNARESLKAGVTTIRMPGS
jgi:imidazolonepropionase-like amidohydrolase